MSLLCYQTIKNSDTMIRGLDMDHDILIHRIPNIAAQLVILGIAAIFISAVISTFLDSKFPMLGFAIGFGLLGIGQRIGERAMDVDR